MMIVTILEDDSDDFTNSSGSLECKNFFKCKSLY